MEKAIRNKAFRSGIVWLTVAALTATGLVYLVQRNGLNPFEGPRDLGDITLLATTTTITLAELSSTATTVTLRATVGPVACAESREVTLFKKGVGSITDAPVQTNNTGLGTTADFVVAKSALTAGLYEARVEAATVPGDCTAATSNTVNVPAS